MGKVPVFGTVSRTYGFVLGEFGTIVRLAWAPLLIGSALTYFYGGQAIDAAIAAGLDADPARAMEFAPVQFLIGMVTFVTGIMASVALLRVVIFGDRKPGLFVYLWLGGTELRLMLVAMLLFIAALAGSIGLGLAIALLGALALAVPAIAVLIPVGMIVLIFVVMWAALRLSLIAPVVVAERNLGVERSWEITRGNALRLFVVLVLTFLPYAVAASFLFFALIGGDLPSLPLQGDLFVPGADGEGAASKAALESFTNSMKIWQLGLMKAIRLHWAEIAVLGFVGNLITTALWAGVLGNAYTAIVGEKA